MNEYTYFAYAIKTSQMQSLLFHASCTRIPSLTLFVITTGAVNYLLDKLLHQILVIFCMFMLFPKRISL